MVVVEEEVEVPGLPTKGLSSCVPLAGILSLPLRSTARASKAWMKGMNQVRGWLLLRF